MIFFIAFAMLVGYFSTQNTQTVIIHFYQYTLHNIPIYIIVLFSFLMGIIFFSISYTLDLFSSMLTLSRVKTKLKNTKEENIRVTKKIHELQVENARLATQVRDEHVDEKTL